MSGLQVSLIRDRSTVWQSWWEHKCFSTQPNPDPVRGPKEQSPWLQWATQRTLQRQVMTISITVFARLGLSWSLLMAVVQNTNCNLYSGLKDNDEELEARLKGTPFVQESTDLENQTINWSAMCSRDQKNMMVWATGLWRGLSVTQMHRAPRGQHETILTAAQQQLAQ